MAVVDWVNDKFTNFLFEIDVHTLCVSTKWKISYSTSSTTTTIIIINVSFNIDTQVVVVVVKTYDLFD